ncbi:MAG: hypothetical protein AB1546_08060 [bacterium]
MTASDPRDFIKEIRKSKFKKLLNSCIKTRYYHERLKKWGVLPGADPPLSKSDWFSLSLVERAGKTDEFYVSGGDIGMEAPGSLKQGGRLYATWAEVERATAFIEFMFRNAGVGESDRFINCYDYSYNGFGVLHQRVCEHMGVFCLPAGKVEPIQIFSRIRPYEITVLMGHSGLLVQLTKIAEREGAPQLKTVFMTSERLPADVRSWMEEIWQCPVYMGFGILGIYPAVAMESLKRDKYIINDLSYIVEIPPEDMSQGEIHITPLDFLCYPVLRLATGTKAVFLSDTYNDDCGCGTMTDLEYITAPLMTTGDLYFNADRFANIIAEKIPGLETRARQIWKGRVATLLFNVEPAVRGEFMRVLAETEPLISKHISLGMLAVEFGDE